MEEIIGYCGINCSACPALIAYQNNDDELRKKTAAEWSEMFKSEMKPEDINCAGCPVEGPHVVYCDSMCEIRSCARARGIATCAECDEYACETLEKFIANVPDAKARLEKLRLKT